MLLEFGFFVLVAIVVGSNRNSSPSKLQARRASRAEARRAVAAACGLQEIEVRPEGTLRARHGTLRVRMDEYGEESRIVRVAIDGVVGGIYVALRSRGGSASSDARDVELGDPGFDGAFLLHGSPATVRALFGSAVRDRTRATFGLDARIQVSDGALVAEFAQPTDVCAPLSTELRALLALAEVLRPGNHDHGLAAIARTDPHPGVRARALETLAGGTPTPQARAVLRDALRDPSAAIRLQAARALGDEGRPTLHALAADATIDDGIAADAIATLGGHMTFARATPLLDRAVAALRPRTARALLAVMGRGSATEAQIIASVLARLSDLAAPPQAEIAQAALEALLDTRAALSEEPFLAALASLRPELAVVGARGLERIGTVRAVPALRDVEPRGGALERAARTAIAAIQSRLTGATPGQVSLAGASGEVSVVESPDGRVSLETDES